VDSKVRGWEGVHIRISLKTKNRMLSIFISYTKKIESIRKSTSFQCPVIL
jgi:hypothetical protein